MGGRNYLRVRGEYCGGFATMCWGVELPPRARRIRDGVVVTPVEIGTTSACAENTGHTQKGSAMYRNYLRVRGEYRKVIYHFWRGMELPPRARRIPWVTAYPTWGLGTTPACAENTHPMPPENLRGRNYLRVRGEYVTVTRCRAGGGNYLRVRGEYPFFG